MTGDIETRDTPATPFPDAHRPTERELKEYRDAVAWTNTKLIGHMVFTTLCTIICLYACYMTYSAITARIPFESYAAFPLTAVVMMLGVYLNANGITSNSQLIEQTKSVDWICRSMVELADWIIRDPRFRETDPDAEQRRRTMAAVYTMYADCWKYPAALIPGQITSLLDALNHYGEASILHGKYVECFTTFASLINDNPADRDHLDRHYRRIMDRMQTGTTFEQAYHATDGDQ